MNFFIKGLDPFKIQASFKLDLFLEILIQNSEGFGVGTKSKIVPFEVVYHHAKFENF
jgi:hypothetical protein